MSVRCAYSLFLLRLVIDDAVADFLNIRKIPLQRFEYPSQGDSTLEQEAAAVRDEMRQVILKDRDLHDRVRLLLLSIPAQLTSRHRAGHQSFRLVHPLLLETRSLVPLPAARPRPRWTRAIVCALAHAEGGGVEGQGEGD